MKVVCNAGNNFGRISFSPWLNSSRKPMMDVIHFCCPDPDCCMEVVVVVVEVGRMFVCGECWNLPGAREVQWWSSGGVRSVGSVVWTEDGKPQEHCFITRKLFLQNFYFYQFKIENCQRNPIFLHYSFTSQGCDSIKSVERKLCQHFVKILCLK